MSQRSHILWSLVLPFACCIVACTGSNATPPLVLPPAMPTPTPTPTPSPTPVPGPLVVTPNAVTLSGTGAVYATTIAVSENPYAPPLAFTESDNCSIVATLTTGNPQGPSATYTITGKGAGTCTATFTDHFGQTAQATINVNTGAVTITGRAHR